MRLLLVSGSTRRCSTNTAALRALRDLAPAGVHATLYDGLADLPAFDPDQDQQAPSVVGQLRAQLAAADAVVFSTPEYAGTLPGSFKNLLDWTVGSGELYGKPVAWINVAAEGRGAGADATMATVLAYVGAEVITAACVHVPVRRDSVGDDGAIDDLELRARFGEVAAEVLRHLNGASTAEPLRPSPLR